MQYLSTIQTINTKNKINIEPFDIPTAPYSELSIDIAGPITQTRTNARFFTLIINRYSKFICTTTHDATPTADTILKTRNSAKGDDLIHTKSITSDQKGQFTSYLYRNTLYTNGITPKKASVQHPQTDSLAEQSIRTIMSKTRILIKISGEPWDKALKGQQEHNTSR
jgi:transposase InsO family protein